MTLGASVTYRPRITVVTPVYNRADELRRALRSVAAQTLSHFECIVVDDASECSLERVVSDFDERFIYVRNQRNTGPNGARRLAMTRMRGEILIGLDSDDEMYPWALARAWHYLQARPEVDAVCGMYVSPDGLQGRVRGGARVVTPQDYAKGRTMLCDVVGAVRWPVVQEWLQADPGYFTLEFRHWLTVGMRHSQLFVDEPWARVNFDSSSRVSHSTDDRTFRDAKLFVQECRPLFGTTPCEPLDNYLRRAWLSLRIRRRPEAALLKAWMDERGIDARSMPFLRAWEKLTGRIRPPACIL